MAVRTPARTLTFLFSDIEGSTRLLETLGSEAYTKVLERHAAIMRDAFARHGGREEGTEGDSFFVLFDQALEAVEAAVEAQRALAAEPWPPGVEVAVRMGLHAGEASASAAGLVGLDINRAARIAAAAHGGQVVVSDAVRSLVAADLGKGVSLRGLGNHRLKDLREPQPLCQVVADGLRMEFPPLRSLDARPNNLPTQLTSFVGRDRELEEAGRLLEANRLVTLTGPGGTGKTRLALQVAANAAERYPDGVFFVALETVREPPLIVPWISSAVGLAEARDLDSALRDWLAPRKVLLVLDNLEQVLDGGPVVAELLRAAPDLSVIVTSRAPLRISGEQEYPVPGLPTPPDPGRLPVMGGARSTAAEPALDLAALATYEAVKLFVARAGAVRPDFAVTNENAPAVASIVARLHGMPLAIELAAARIKVLSPDAILARLENQLGLLSGGARDLPARQQTLRGAIAWSYELLDRGQCRLLDRLSVFAGGFDLPAAEAVCGPAAELEVEVLEGLEALVDHSLLRTADSDGEPRFGMLETIRQFGAEMLEVRGEGEAIRGRHARWYLALVERLAPALAGTEQRGLLDLLEREHDNIRAVIDRAMAADDADAAIRMVAAVWRFWQKRGHLYEARRRVDQLAAAPSSTHDPRLRARLMEVLGGICWWQGDIAAMRPAYAEAVALWRELGDRGELANALYNYSFVFTVPDMVAERGSVVDPTGEGRRTLDEALALYEQIGDERGQANVLWGLGNQAFFHDETDHGATDFRRALDMFRRVGDRTMEAWALHMLGGALLKSGEHVEAGVVARQALRIFHDTGDAAGVTLALDDIGQQALVAGDSRRAARLWGAARGLTASTGARLADYNEAWTRISEELNVRTLLAPEELEVLAREGAAMSLDDVVAYALEERPDAGGASA